LVNVSPSTSATNAHAPLVAVPREQLYYWSEAWQENERIAVAELERGEGRIFASAVDAIRWLMTDED
jgi:hypothetical protein